MEPLRIFYSEPPIAQRELSIHALGLHEPMPAGMVNRPSGTGDHLIMHFYGETVIGRAWGEETVAAGTVMVWGPRDSHRYGQPRARWLHSLAALRRRGSRARALAAAGVPLAEPIRGVDAGIVESCVQALHGEIHRHAHADAGIVLNYIDTLARELGRVVHGEPRSVPGRWLALRRYLEERFDQRLRLETLARRAGCSAQHLCSEFRRHFGSPPVAFVIRQRMHRAMMLLRNRSLSITAVAAAVGYDDIQQFSRLFRSRHRLLAARCARAARGSARRSRTESRAVGQAPRADAGGRAETAARRTWRACGSLILPRALSPGTGRTRMQWQAPCGRA